MLLHRPIPPRLRPPEQQADAAAEGIRELHETAAAESSPIGSPERHLRRETPPVRRREVAGEEEVEHQQLVPSPEFLEEIVQERQLMEEEARAEGDRAVEIVRSAAEGGFPAVRSLRHLDHDGGGRKQKLQLLRQRFHRAGQRQLLIGGKLKINRSEK